MGTDPDEARAVARLIAKWKTLAKAAQEEEKRAAMDRAQAEKINAAREKLQRRLVALEVGGGRDAQLKTMRDLESAFEAGPVEALRFVVSLKDRKPRRAVRPRKLRIW